MRTNTSLISSFFNIFLYFTIWHLTLLRLGLSSLKSLALQLFPLCHSFGPIFKKPVLSYWQPTAVLLELNIWTSLLFFPNKSILIAWVFASPHPRAPIPDHISNYFEQTYMDIYCLISVHSKGSAPPNEPLPNNWFSSMVKSLPCSLVSFLNFSFATFCLYW